MTFPKLYNESVGELRRFYFWFLSGTLFFIPMTLNPRLIREVNEVLRPMDKPLIDISSLADG